MAELDDLIATWWRSVNDLVDVASGLHDADWDRPTDLDGWDVRAVVSHVAHLEGVLAGAPQEQAEVPIGGHVRSPMGQFTEIGVLTRRDTPPAEIIDEIRRYTAKRHEELLASPPDPDAPAPGVFGAIGWTNRTLLRNRPLDVWMHEQDVRRAVGRPGNLDSPGADHATSYLLESMGFILAKRAGAAPGSTLVVRLVGEEPVAFEVDENGKGRRLPEVPADATVTLSMDRETFLLLAGGRRDQRASVTRGGDEELSARIVDNLAVTP